jgi:hypothetical protein
MVKTISNKNLNKKLDEQNKTLKTKTNYLNRKINKLSKLITVEMGDQIEDISSMELFTKYYSSPAFWLDSSIKCYITYFTTYFISKLIGKGFDKFADIIDSHPEEDIDDNDKIIGYKNVIIWKCFLELFFLLWATMLFKHIWAKMLKELFDKFDLFDTDLSTISWGLASWGITLGILIGTDRIKLLFNAIMYNIFKVM